MPWNHHQTFVDPVQAGRTVAFGTGKDKLGDAIIDSHVTVETRLLGANHQESGYPCFKSRRNGLQVTLATMRV